MQLDRAHIGPKTWLQEHWSGKLRQPVHGPQGALAQEVRANESQLMEAPATENCTHY